MFSINARMFQFISINYELVNSAVAGDRAITITSFDAAPLVSGQKFTLMEPGGASAEVELDGDQFVLANLLTTLNVQPLPSSIVAGALTGDLRQPRTGNPINQSVLLERWASIELHSPKTEASEVLGNAQIIQIVAGRWKKPHLTGYPWPSSDMTMQYQRDEVSYVEGIFKPENPNRSRLNTNMYFGDRCQGIFVSDSKPKVVSGVISNVCC